MLKEFTANLHSLGFRTRCSGGIIVLTLADCPESSNYNFPPAVAQVYHLKVHPVLYRGVCSKML